MVQIGLCDMCGSETRLYKAEIEGTLLNVCSKCAKYGKVIATVSDKKFIEKMEKKVERTKKSVPVGHEITQILVEEFHEIIKKKRESLGLKQEDFAKKINEKLSLIHKIETGNFEPSIQLARKIEKFLKVKLIEQMADNPIQQQSMKGKSFTLGDFIKIRKRE